MKDPNKIRIWKLNTPIRKALFNNAPQIVGIYIDNDFLNQLAIDYPYNYLSILSDWKAALYNQIAFRLDGDGRLHIACFFIKDGEVTPIDLTCAIGDNEVYIVGTNNRYTHGEWLTCKTQERSIFYLNKKNK